MKVWVSELIRKLIAEAWEQFRNQEERERSLLKAGTKHSHLVSQIFTVQVVNCGDYEEIGILGLKAT
jgi:hypothetical protein